MGVAVCFIEPDSNDILFYRVYSNDILYANCGCLGTGLQFGIDLAHTQGVRCMTVAEAWKMFSACFVSNESEIT